MLVQTLEINVKTLLESHGGLRIPLGMHEYVQSDNIPQLLGWDITNAIRFLPLVVQREHYFVRKNLWATKMHSCFIMLCML